MLLEPNTEPEVLTFLELNEKLHLKLQTTGFYGLPVKRKEKKKGRMVIFKRAYDLLIIIIGPELKNMYL